MQYIHIYPTFLYVYLVFHYSFFIATTKKNENPTYVIDTTFYPLSCHDSLKRQKTIECLRAQKCNWKYAWAQIEYIIFRLHTSWPLPPSPMTTATNDFCRLAAACRIFSFPVSSDVQKNDENKKKCHYTRIKRIEWVVMFERSQMNLNKTFRLQYVITMANVRVQAALCELWAKFDMKTQCIFFVVLFISVFNWNS